LASSLFLRLAFIAFHLVFTFILSFSIAYLLTALFMPLLLVLLFKYVHSLSLVSLFFFHSFVPLAIV
jgi:hypothetical protein